MLVSNSNSSPDLPPTLPSLSLKSTVLEPHSSQTRALAVHPMGEHRPLPSQHIWSPSSLSLSPPHQVCTKAPNSESLPYRTGCPTYPPRHTTGFASLPHSQPPGEPRQGRAEQTGEGTCSGADQRPRSTRGRSLGHLRVGFPLGDSQPRLRGLSHPGPKPCADTGALSPSSRDTTGDHHWTPLRRGLSEPEITLVGLAASWGF